MAKKQRAQDGTWQDYPTRSGWWIVLFSSGKMYALRVRKRGSIYWLDDPDGWQRIAHTMIGKCTGPFKTKRAAEKSVSPDKLPPKP